MGKKNTKDDRNEFNPKYYKNNNLSLYLDIQNFTEELLETANYQTLFAKDYYTILRPSLCFDFPNIIENKKKSHGLVIFFAIIIIIILILGFIILWKYLRLRISGKEFNLKNLKEQPLLG